MEERRAEGKREKFDGGCCAALTQKQAPLSGADLSLLRTGVLGGTVGVSKEFLFGGSALASGWMAGSRAFNRAHEIIIAHLTVAF